MSKARITYRFDQPRKAAGQAGHPIETQESQPYTENKAAPFVPKPGKDSRAANVPFGSNVVPLRHEEFELTEEPVVIEERELKPPLSPSLRQPERDSETEWSGTSDVQDRSFLRPYPYDFGAWSDPVENESDRLEKVIRETGLVAEDEENEWPERSRRRRIGTSWDDEDEFAETETGFWQPQTERRRYGRAKVAATEGTAWWKIAASVVGAVATGVVFGSFALSMFTSPSGDGASQMEGVLQANQPGLAPELSHGAAAGTAIADPDALAESALASVQLPERRMFLLQNGVFDSIEGARTLAEAMKAKGLAATIEEGENFTVFAGVSSDRDAALRASRLLQTSGIEVYIKPFELPAVQQVRWTAAEGTAEPLAVYLQEGSGLVQMIGDVTLVHLDGEAPVAPEPSTIEAVKGAHRALTEASPSAEGGLPADAQPVVKRMDDAARTAVVALEEYAAHPDHAYLWSAQSALMDYIIAEKQLLTMIAAR